MQKPRFLADGIFLLMLLTSSWLGAHGQDSISADAGNFTYGIYSEIYYSYDFSNPDDHLRPPFLYSFNRHNELSANLLLAYGAYHSDRIRARLGLMTGTYAQYNLAAEPDWAKRVYEATIGIKLSQARSLWLEAGIMPSHIGFESAIGADCPTLTRSLSAENSPYYETGLKLAFTSRSGKLLLNAFVLNGWQRIQRPDYIQNPSFGLQANWQLNDNLLLNYSLFAGSDQPDSLNARRTYHNFYLIISPSESWKIIGGFDMGRDKDRFGTYANWAVPTLIVSRTLTDRWKMAFRGEYFADDSEVLINNPTGDGFNTLGLSVNSDHQIHPAVQFRVELRYFQSDNYVYANSKDENFSLTGSLSFRFDR